MVTGTNIKELEKSKETHYVLLATLIVTYQPLVSLRSLPKEMVFQVQNISLDEKGKIGPLDLLTSLHATSTYSDM
jgi:hypothetical protein